MNTEIIYKIILAYRIQAAVQNSGVLDDVCLGYMNKLCTPKISFLRVQFEDAFKLISLMKELYDVHPITLQLLAKKDKHRVFTTNAATSVDVHKK